MANSNERSPGGPGRVVVLDTTGTVELGNVSPRFGGSWILHVKNGGAAPGSFIPKTRATGSAYASSEYQNTIYWQTDDENLIAAGTPIADEGVYGVPCDGCDLFLDYTEDTDGMEVIANPIIGV